MKLKDNILILTSMSSDNTAVSSIEDYFNRFHQDYNIIVLTEKEYGQESSAKRRENTRIRRLQNLPDFYRKFKTLKLKGSKKTNFGIISERKAMSDKMRGTTQRIYNAVIRFCPDIIIVTTPKTMQEAVLAKRKAKFKYPILGLMNRFTVDREMYSYHADGYIVENADMKKQITSFGFPGNKIFVMGMPIYENMPTIDNIIKKKEQLELNANHTVYLSGGAVGARDIMPVFEMLVDQGSLFNIMVNCGTNGKMHSEILRIIDEKKLTNVRAYVELDNKTVNSLLLAADSIMTVCDTGLIYRAFLLNLPVIAFAPNNAQDRADLEYLESKKLIYYAHDYNFTIIGLYKLLQTNLSKKLVEAASVRTHPNALEEICDFIADFAKRRKENA